MTSSSTMPADVPPVRIGVAVVEHDDRFLVGIRHAATTLAGCAEFPGGKCHADEPTDACASRECLEETGLSVNVIRLLTVTRFEYDFGPLKVHFWHCEPESPDHVRNEHNGFQWFPRNQLNTLPFPAANRNLLDSLVRH